MLSATAPCGDGGMNDDLDNLTAAELRGEVARLRAGIRQHRDSTGHDLCWHHPDLWGLLPEPADPHVAVPEWSDFLRGCVRYRESLDQQLPSAANHARVRLLTGESSPTDPSTRNHVLLHVTKAEADTLAI